MANPDDAINANATTESADPTHHTEIAVSRWVGQLLEDRRHSALDELHER